MKLLVCVFLTVVHFSTFDCKLKLILPLSVYTNPAANYSEAHSSTEWGSNKTHGKSDIHTLGYSYTDGWKWGRDTNEYDANKNFNESESVEFSRVAETKPQPSVNRDTAISPPNGQRNSQGGMSNNPYGSPYGMPNNYLNGASYGSPYGMPGNPSYGSPYGMPYNPMYGAPNSSPYYGMPNNYNNMYGAPNGSPYGMQNNPLYGVPNGSPYGMPNNPSYGAQYGSSYGMPNNRMYGATNGSP